MGLRNVGSLDINTVLFFPVFLHVPFTIFFLPSLLMYTLASARLHLPPGFCSG